MNITFKELNTDDVENYKLIRLELLKNEPTSFGSSFDEERLFPYDVWFKRLDKKNVITFGAFLDTSIIGIAVLVMSPRKKMKHIATLNSMYIKKEYRKMDIAKNLIKKLEERAEKYKLKRINLSVVSTNNPARNLYKKLGFIEYGLEPETIKHEEMFYDLVLMTKELNN